jgi:DNA-binding FadR family transcriptional regulator
VVAAPSTAPVVQSFLVYLTHSAMSLGDLFEARQSLEGSIARLAAERADESQIAALRAQVAADHERDTSGDDHVHDATAHHALHTMVAAAARNPAAELFVEVLGRLTARYSYDPSLGPEERRTTNEASNRAHAAIVDAITAGDSALAERRMGMHLDALADWLGRHRVPPRSLDWVLDDAEGYNGGEKLGSRVARSIIVDIVDRDWPIGEVIGSETELINRYDVSRSALREAIRLLEYHEVAVMKRGPGGGLVVTVPSIDPIVRTATVFLQHRGISAGDLIAIRRDLETDAVAYAVERCTPADVEGLRRTLITDAEAGFESPVHEDLHVRIAELTGNAAISLFLRVTVELTRLHASFPGRRSRRRVAINAEADRAHTAIVEAIADRDAPLARRRMGKHLAAMQPLLR